MGSLRKIQTEAFEEIAVVVPEGLAPGREHFRGINPTDDASLLGRDRAGPFHDAKSLHEVLAIRALEYEPKVLRHKTRLFEKLPGRCGFWRFVLITLDRASRKPKIVRVVLPGDTENAAFMEKKDRNCGDDFHGRFYTRGSNGINLPSLALPVDVLPFELRTLLHVS